MLLYYMISYTGGGTRSIGLRSTPYWALAYLALSAICWGWLLTRLFRRWFILPAAERRHINQLLRSGTVRDAEVVACQAVGKRATETPHLDVTFRFNNLSGVPIRETLRVVDNRPMASRFTIGRRARLRIDKTLAGRPVAVIDSTELHTNQAQRFLQVLGWLLLVAAVAGYYIGSYRHEHLGTGWRFLTYYHPLLICPLTLMSMWWLFDGGISRFFTDVPDTVHLKYKGYRAQARLLEAIQTGTYINEQPQVRFKLEYEDMHGTTHLASLRKIVGLLDMDITRADTIPIFYLADQPQTVAFAADLGNAEE